MRALASLLSLLLVLLTGGVVETLSVALDEAHAECADEEAGSCADCDSSCALCSCCPLRGAPVQRTVGPVLVEAPATVVVLTPAVRMAAAVSPDIFRPPTA